MKVGKRIKDYIQSAGISQMWLAKKTGIPVAKLNLALNGKRRMTFEEYEYICWALNVDASRFIIPKAPENRGA